MTNRRAIQRAATREANTVTHQESTTSMLATATPSTSQSSRNHRIGVAMSRLRAKGCRSFWNVNRDLSGKGGSALPAVGGEGIRNSAKRTGRPAIIYAARVLSHRNCVAARSVVLGIRPEQNPQMLARLDQGGSCLARAGVEPPVVSEEPGEARAAGARGGLAVEQGGKQAECVDELAHRCAGLRVRRRRQQKLEPGHTALGQS